MTISESANPGLVFETITAYQRSAALRAAVELDLFRALGEGKSRLDDLAAHCRASRRGTRILCDYLAIAGLIVKDGEGYRHTPTSAAFLDPQSPACIASTIRLIHNPGIREPFDHLADIIRNGRTSLPGEGTVEPENPIWVEFAHSMVPMMRPLAGPLGDAVLEGRRDPVRVLDVAAGHGLFGIEIARRDPAAQVVALDWAPVLEVARANAEKAGVASRYALKPGSAFEVDFEGPYDIILLTNFLHHFDPDTCRELLRKCHRALVPDGQVAALEFVPNPDRVTPPDAASFALTMLATTTSGDAYTFPEYERMLREAGFVDAAMKDIPRSPHRIVTARRAAS